MIFRIENGAASVIPNTRPHWLTKGALYRWKLWQLWTRFTIMDSDNYFFAETRLTIGAYSPAQHFSEVQFPKRKYANTSASHSF